ncbi:MAG TPA: hypothetical protein PJ990_03925 [Saprospiraceae bacterium]|nr:hypothetical protein [Saprospiraceae bacterium]
MKRIIIFLSTIIFSFNILRSEIQIYKSIFDLCLESTEVHEAIFWKEIDETYLFLSKKIGQKGEYNDTIFFYNVEDVIAEKQQLQEENDQIKLYQELKVDSFIEILTPTLRNAEKIIFFVSRDNRGKLVPIVGGYRLINENKVYFPLQRLIPSKYYFDKDRIKPNELISELNDALERKSEMISIFKNTYHSHQQQQYKKWLKKIKKACKNSNYNHKWGKLGEYIKFHMSGKGEILKVRFEEMNMYVRDNYFLK